MKRASQAIEATFAAYDRMMAILAEVAPVGANLVSLHAQAYETIRRETDLPARLVTLGLRDRAGYVAGRHAAPNSARRQAVRDQGTDVTDHQHGQGTRLGAVRRPGLSCRLG